MIGKINDRLFSKSILPNQGAKLPEVIVGPQMGVDAAVLKLGRDFLVIAEDPIFPGPTMSPEDFGWLTVHIGASDVAVMGIKPRYMTYSLLLPPGTNEDYIQRLTNSIDKYAQELEIAIVGGHTGFYGAVTIPTIGGITVWGTGDSYITPSGAQIGDTIIMTKGAAIEAAALLAGELGAELIDKGVKKELVDRAKKRLKEVTVVNDARLAMEVGGVNAMHDATEGGVVRGLWEIAQASNVGMKIMQRDIPVPEDIAAICSFFNLNPYEIISEGTLVLTCQPSSAEALLEKFIESGIDAKAIGEVTPAKEGCYWKEDDGRQTVLVPPESDLFWDVFFNALELKGDTGNDSTQKLCQELKQTVNRLVATIDSRLIPEIGANIAYAAKDAGELGDIAAIPGRLLRFKGGVIPLGEPEMGCSHYMGGTLLAIREYFPEAACIMNLYNNEAIRNACVKLGYHMLHMPTPADYRQTDADYYNDLRDALKDCAALPAIIEIPDRINLERLVLVLGKDLAELESRVSALSSAFNSPLND